MAAFAFDFDTVEELEMMTKNKLRNIAVFCKTACESFLEMENARRNCGGDVTVELVEAEKLTQAGALFMKLCKAQLELVQLVLLNETIDVVNFHQRFNRLTRRCNHLNNLVETMGMVEVFRML